MQEETEHSPIYSEDPITVNSDDDAESVDCEVSFDNSFVRHRRGRPLNPSRKFFVPNGARATCMFCSTSVRNRSGTDMKHHLKSCERFLKEASKGDLAAICSNQLTLEAVRDFPTRFDTKRADNLLASWILASGVSFTVLDRPEFREFLNYWRKGYSGVSRSKFTDVFLKQYSEEAMTENKLIIDNSDYITLAIDGWSSRSRQSVYGITVVTSTGKELLLDAIHLKGDPASGQNLANLLRSVIQGIPKKKVVAITTDGARNVETMRNLLKTEMPWLVSLKCITHLLNVLCKRLCDVGDVNEVIHLCEQIATTFNMSNKLSFRLKEAGAARLASVSSTRFATSVDVLKSVLQNQNAIKAVSALPDVRLKPACSRAIMDNTFWGSLTQLVDLLTPLRELIRKSESTLFTLSQCFGEYINLCKDMVMIIPKCPSWAPLLKNFVGELSRVFEELATPVAKLALIFDANYYYLPSTKSMEEARCYLKDLATSRGIDEESCCRLLTEYDDFIGSYQTSSAWDCLSARKYPFFSHAAKRVLACNSNSMSCERCFSIMSWLNSSRGNRMTMDNLACYTKAYLHLRSKGAIKREIVKEEQEIAKDEQQIDDAQVFFYENSRSEERVIESWYPSDAEELFEKISSIFATSRDFESFPGKCCAAQAGDIENFVENF